MTEYIYQAKDAEPIRFIADAFGEEVTLSDQDGDHVYRLLREFRLGGVDYAVLRADTSEEDDYQLFRIVKDDAGELELESIDDDEEWEAVAEVYDEMTFEP